MRVWSVCLLAAVLAGCRTLTDEERGEEPPPPAPPSSPTQYRVESVGEFVRTEGPIDLSSIDWVRDDLYVAASDSDGVLAELEIGIDPADGAITSFLCARTNVLQTAVDVEGLVFDRFSCRIWAADEASTSICEYDLAGDRLRKVRMPPSFKSCRTNYGIESLAIDASGLVMWTCNEETLSCDGEQSSKQHGSTVRLTKFVRDGVAAEWRLAGQWAYRTGRIKGNTYRGIAMSGVADLCVLPDGTLIVLEREMSRSILPRFRMRLYQVDFSDATEISGFDSLTGADWKPVRKSRIYEEHTGRANYEGMCLGPRLADGSLLLLLVSDGDGIATERLYTLRLKPASR